MIGTGIGFGVSGFVMNNGLRPVLDLYFSQDKSLTALAGPTPVFSRASVGRYADSSGLNQSAAIDVARFHHEYSGSSWLSRGLLIEGQRTNVSPRSETFDAVYWAKTRMTVTADSTQSPSGATDADTLAANTTSASGAYCFNSVTPISGTGTTVTASCFFKPGTANFSIIDVSDTAGSNGVRVWFNVSTGTVGSSAAYGTGWALSGSAKIEASANGFYRCVMTFSKPAATNMWTIISVANADNSISVTSGDSIYAWGMQVCDGAYRSSYVPTAGTTVTRSADVCQITSTDFSNIWSVTQGTFVFEGICPASGTIGLLSVNDGTSSERMELYASGTSAKFIVVDGGATQADITAGTISYGTAFKLAVAYSANDFAASLNGAAAVTDAAGTLPTVTQMNLGANQAGDYLFGTISRLRYYNKRLTDAELVGLST